MSDISINTNPESDIFENTYKYPEWYNKKKYTFYNIMLARLKKLSYVLTRSSQYYGKMNYYVFGPSIALTAISGIASFLSTSSFIESNTQNAFGVSVGIIASISSVMQSIGGACQFSAKQEGHRSTAEQYNNLIVKTKFEIEMPNEENFADDLEVMILDIQGKCNFFPPQFIVDAYENKQRIKSPKEHELEGSFENDNTSINQKHPTKKLSKNYNTFNNGTSINDFSLETTHDEHISMNIEQNIPINNSVNNSTIDTIINPINNLDVLGNQININDEQYVDGDNDNKSSDLSTSQTIV